MNINPINSYTGINNKSCRNKSNPAFKHAIFEGELKEIFATPKQALIFMDTFKRIQKIPLNLKEILDYNKRTGIYKMILDEFFKFIGEDAVKDFPVTLKPEPIYQGDDLLAYDTILYGTFPVNGDNYTPCGGDKNYVANYPIASSFNDCHYKTERFLTGKEYNRYYNGGVNAPYDPEIYLCNVKEALSGALFKRFSNIYDSIVNRNKEMDKTTEDSVWKTLQSVITADEPLFEEEDAPDIDDVGILTSAYNILNITSKQSYSAEYIIKSLFKNVGINVENNNSYSARIKGQKNIGSLIRKMLSCAQSGKSLMALRRNKSNEVLESVYDIYGVRFKAQSQREINKFYNEFVNFIKSGVIKPTHIMNYHASFTEPIFSDKQIQELKALTEKLGLKTEFHDARRESGFTCTNIRTKVVIENGKEQPVEIQVCNRDIAFLIDILHVAYDVLEGKNVLSQYDSEKKAIIKPLVDALTIIKNDEVLREKFSRYTAICYSVARDESREFPDISEYDLPEIVSVEKMAEVYEQLNNIVYA